MQIVVTPTLVDLIYHVVFKEPQIDFIREDNRIPLFKKIIQSFELTINLLKVSDASISDNWAHFSKFYGQTFFDVSFGLEQVHARLQHLQNEDQIFETYGKLALLFNDIDLASQKITLYRHLKVEEGNNLSFLNLLNQYTPDRFKKIIHSKGATYTLKIPEHNLTIFIMISESLFTENGIFLSIEGEFYPNKYLFEEAFKIAKHYHDIIFEGLGLQINTKEV
jgi:hypothetical protein